MKDVFVSKDQNFKSRIGKMRNNMIFLVPVLLFAIVVITYSSIYHKGERRRTKFQQLEEGLSYMNSTDITVSFLVCVVVAIGLYVVIRSYHKKRKIIVGLKFNDKDKELTVKTKNLSGDEREGRFKYSYMRFERDRVSDGMTPPRYDVFTLYHHDILIGHLYANHFTWNATEYNDMVTRIKNS